MTVPDLAGLVSARKRMNGPNSPKPGYAKRLAPDEVRQLRELAAAAERDGGKWRPVGGSDG